MMLYVGIDKLSAYLGIAFDIKLTGAYFQYASTDEFERAQSLISKQYAWSIYSLSSIQHINFMIIIRTAVVQSADLSR